MSSDITDLYNPETDDPSYGDLVKARLVLDETGTVKLIPPTDSDFDLIHCHTIGLSTPSGRGLFTAWKSSMQKAIRRCKVEDTLVAIVECCNLGGQFASNIVNRLCKVIISEDIGAANPLLAIDCWKFVHEYELRKCGIREMLSEDMKKRLLDIGYRMAISRKSRLVCNMICSITLDSDLDFDESFKHLKFSLFYNDLEEAVRNALECEKCKIQGSLIDVRDTGLKRRRGIYQIWNYLLDESEIDPILKSITHSLCMLYDRAGDEASLLLVGAVINIMRWDAIKEEQKESSCPYTWNEISKLEIYPMSCAYDKHVVETHGKINRANSFWLCGAKIANRHPALTHLDDKYYSKCVGRSGCR